MRLVGGIGRTRRSRERGELGLRDEVYAAPSSDEWRDAWSWTEAILERMNDDVRARGSRFGVVTLSNAIQVDPVADVRAEHARRLGVEDLDYPDRRIAAVGRRAGFSVLTLVPPMRRHAQEQDVQLHGFENTALGTGHWNERGHRVAAELIGEWLCRELADP
jgi:hypothetical protein